MKKKEAKTKNRRKEKRIAIEVKRREVKKREVKTKNRREEKSKE